MGEGRRVKPAAIGFAQFALFFFEPASQPATRQIRVDQADHRGQPSDRTDRNGKRATKSHPDMHAGHGLIGTRQNLQAGGRRFDPGTLHAERP